METIDPKILQRIYLDVILFSLTDRYEKTVEGYDAHLRRVELMMRSQFEAALGAFTKEELEKIEVSTEKARREAVIASLAHLKGGAA